MVRGFMAARLSRASVSALSFAALLAVVSQQHGASLVNATPLDPIISSAVPASDPSRFTYYDMLTPLSVPCDLTQGPDGAEWVEELLGNKLVRIDPETGAVAEYSIPFTVPANDNQTLTLLPNGGPVASCALVTGYDGLLYASNGLRNQLVIMNVSSKHVTAISPPANVLGNLEPLNDVTAAPDGIYFTQTTANLITKYDYTTGIFTSFKIPTPLAVPVGIYYASDGGIWFCEFGANKIGRFDRSTHSFEEWDVPASLAGPVVMRAETKQRYLYFAATLGNAIGRIDMFSHQLTAYTVPTPLSTPVEDCPDADGNIWFTHIGMNALGKLDPDTGNITEVALPGTLTGGSPISLPFYLGSGIFCRPGNAIWFTEGTLNRAGRYQL